MATKRISWIDAVKGIAIILLLFSHSMTNNDLLKNWILSFRIPIFFIICGYIVNLKYSNGFEQGQFFDLLSKRWYNLLTPYFLFGVILIVYFNVIRFLGNVPLNVKTLLIDLVSFKGIASLWFLPVYFFSELFLISLLGLFKGFYRYMVVAFLIVLLSLVKQGSLSWPFDLMYRIAAGSVFVFVGYFFASHGIEEKINGRIAMLLILFFSICTYFNRGASMMDMKIVPLYFINAIGINLGFISLVNSLGDKYGSNKLLTFYGKNSLIVICTNNIIIESIRLIDYKLFGNKLLVMGWGGYLGTVVLFIIVVLCEYPLLKMLGGKFSRKVAIEKA